jgi:TRAP-type mannitol/chloroaromatic compound transport system permease small subunit
MPKHAPIARTVALLDKAALWSGLAVGWLIVPMVLSLVYEVVARYAFNAPTVWAYDMTFMTYGAFFMLGAAYTLQRAGHIRTDSLYGGWSARTQGIVDTICYLIFFFPPMLLFLWVTLDFFVTSYERGERSVTSPWMPLIWPLKAVLPASCVLLLIQGTSELLRSIHAARTGEWIAREAPMADAAGEEKPNV